MKYVRWTNHEEKFLRENYGQVPFSEIYKTINRHSRKAVRQRAKKLNLSRPGCSINPEAVALRQLMRCISMQNLVFINARNARNARPQPKGF